MAPLRPSQFSAGSWEPDRSAVHRLIQIVDILAIALNQYRQSSFTVTSQAKPDYTPERRQTQLSRLVADYCQIKYAVFAGEYVAPQYLADALATEAIAELVRQGSSDHEGAVRRAT